MTSARWIVGCTSLVAALAVTGCRDEGGAGEQTGTGTGTDDGADDGVDDGDGTAEDDADDGGSDGGEGNGLPAQPMHRLNRLEYNNTVRDLLGTTLQPADTFAPDAEANGFDNMAAQLGISPGLLDGYSKAARDALTEAVDDQPVYAASFQGEAVGAPGGYPVGELWALTGDTANVTFDVEVAGDYQLAVTTGAIAIGAVPAPEATLSVDGMAIASFVVPGSGAAPVEQTFALTLTPGPHTVTLAPTNWINEAAANNANNVLVESIALESDALTTGPGRALVYVCEPSGAPDDACVQEIIETFAFRAWRRPVSDAEMSGLSQLHQSLIDDGETADDALQLVLRAIMTSPKFLFRARTFADTDSEQWLDPYVLASRLSYFVWSSMPDAALFEAAADGSLATDEGLSEQLARMLADEKAQALVDGFAEQWLSTRLAANAAPSAEAYPQFDEPLRAAMIEESRRFFSDYLFNGLPVASMLDPNFAYRNDRLAEHYGMAPVGSVQMTRVPASANERRGLLSLSAWLTSQSHAEHSSPIRRGLWVSDRLLCTAVPPPPAGLEIEPVEFGEGGTVREQLEAHRSDPSCASCHVLLDGIGIGFEEFDGVAAPVPTVGLDYEGELPSGETFEGATELAALQADRDVFVGCLARKLYMYALGRPVEPADASALAAITTDAFQTSFDLPKLLDAIVHTPSFRSPATLTEGQ